MAQGNGEIRTEEGQDLKHVAMVTYRTGEISPDEDDQDPDDLALQQANAELQAESGQSGQPPQSGQDQPPQNQPPTQQPPANQPGQAPSPAAPQTPPPAAAQQGMPGTQPGQSQPAPGTQPAPDAVHQIPKPRFDEAMAKKDEVIAGLQDERTQLIAAAGYLKSQGDMYRERLEAIEAPAQEAARVAAEKAFDDRVTEQDQRLKQAGTDFDAGTINMSQFLEIQSDVQATKGTIESERTSYLAQRSESAATQPTRNQPGSTPDPKAAPAAPHPDSYSLADKLELDRQLDYLAQHHPYLGLMTDDQMLTLRGMVKGALEARGEILTPGAQGDYFLRAEIGKLSDYFGPQWYPQHAGTPAQPQPNGSIPPGHPPGQPAPLTPAAQARLNKMQMANEMPPDPANFGSAAGAAGPVPTEAQIENMSEDDLMNLPPGTLDRLSV